MMRYCRALSGTGGIDQLSSSFNISEDSMVVTSSYVTSGEMPILLVTHEYDEEDDEYIWQFHCGNGDYAMERMQLVRLGTILNIDPSILTVANLAVGYQAKRASPDEDWRLSHIEGA